MHKHSISNKNIILLFEGLSEKTALFLLQHLIRHIVIQYLIALFIKVICP
jgi:hypothetical protein